MARNAKGREPQVTETEYVAISDGPEEDTGIFYQRTPAPGERQISNDGAAPEARRRSSKDDEPNWLKRPTPTGGEEVVVAKRRSSSLVLILVASVGVALLLVAAIAGIALFSGGETAEVPVEEPDQFEGIRVKKGLR